jgi:hypothetical protein
VPGGLHEAAPLQKLCNYARALSLQIRACFRRAARNNPLLRKPSQVQDDLPDLFVGEFSDVSAAMTRVRYSSSARLR